MYVMILPPCSHTVAFWGSNVERGGEHESLLSFFPHQIHLDAPNNLCQQYP